MSTPSRPHSRLLLEAARASLADLNPQVRQAAQYAARGGLNALTPEQKEVALSDEWQARLLLTMALEVARIHDAQKLYSRILILILLSLCGLEVAQYMLSI